MVSPTRHGPLCSYMLQQEAPASFSCRLNCYRSFQEAKFRQWQQEPCNRHCLNRTKDAGHPLVDLKTDPHLTAQASKPLASDAIDTTASNSVNASAVFSQQQLHASFLPDTKDTFDLQMYLTVWSGTRFFAWHQILLASVF